MQQQILSSSTLEHCLPIYKVENNAIVSKYGDITFAYRVFLPEIFSVDEREYEVIHANWVKAIKLLPDYSVVHKQDYYFTKKYMPKIPDEASFLTTSFFQHFIERPFSDHECYLYITKSNKTNLRKNSLFTTLSRGRLVPKEILNPDEIQQFINACQQFVSIMEEGNQIQLTQLTSEDIIGTETVEGLLDRYFTLSNSEEENSLKDICLTNDCLKIGDKYAILHTIADVDDLPSTVNTSKPFEALSSTKSDIFLSFSAPLGLGLSCDHILNQYIFIDNSDDNLRKLNSTKQRMTALSKYSHANEINRQFIDEYISQAHAYSYKSIRAHVNVFAFTEDENNIKAIRTMVGTAFAKMNCAVRHNTMEAPILYWSAIPGNAADFPREDTFHSFIEPAVCFFTNETNFRDSSSPFGIKMVDRFSGKPLHVDISDEPMRKGLIQNRNKFILGPSGSGKSYFTNHLVRQYYEQGAHVMIIDIGNSYLGLQQFINQKSRGKDGIYIEYTSEHPIAFNPFKLPSDSKRFDEGKKNLIIAILKVVWKKPEEFISMSEENNLAAIVDSFLKKIEKNEVENPNFNSFYEYLLSLKDSIMDRPEYNSDYFDYYNLCENLKLYYKEGTYGFLLNASYDTDYLSKRFVVFELDNIKDDKILLPIVTSIIMESFTSKVFKLKGIRKVLLIEEAWKAIMVESMANYIKWLYKTVRKHFGEAIVVTQEIEDIISSPIVKDSIINNSDCKILLDQIKYQNKFDAIQALLGLTQKEVAQILSINRNLDLKRNYKEVFISLGGRYSNVYATEVSREEHYFYTTEQKEKMELFETAANDCCNNIELATKILAERDRELLKKKAL